MSTNTPINARQLMSEAKFFEGYARWEENKSRYETWDEAVDRVMNMHKSVYKEKMTDELSELINEATISYKEKFVLGAQRALQFGGDQIKKHNMRLYNCTSTYADRPAYFNEIFYVLLTGAGAGFSVQKHHVAKLPKILERKKQAKVFEPEDSIEGWADCVGVLMASYFEGGGAFPEYEGRRIYFDLSKIRSKGSIISGGFKAPGPEPLRRALDKIEYLLQGRILKNENKLRPIDVYDITMHIADAVLSGGVRRAATIALFSYDDNEMMTAKTGNWFTENPQRARSNNSVLIVRDQLTKEQFHDIMTSVKEFGEPGFVFSESTEFNFNPCFTGETLVAVADGRNAVSIEQLANEGVRFPVYSAKNKTSKITNGNAWKSEIKWAVAAKTGTKKVLELKLSNGDTFKCTENHKLAVPGGTYIQAKNSLGVRLSEFYTVKNKYRIVNSESDGNSRQYRMLWKFLNGDIPKGYEIDHIQNNGDDSINNLQLLLSENHRKKSGFERLGEKNGIHKIADVGAWKQNMSASAFMENNPKFSGITNEEIIENGKLLLRMGYEITLTNLIKMDKRTPSSFSKNRFGGSLKTLKQICQGILDYQLEYPKHSEKIDQEKMDRTVYVKEIIDNNEISDVFDLTVEDNHNFYIITSGDENYDQSRGVLVHNCVEIGMFPQINGVSGWQGCNLTEVNGSKCTNEENFLKACRAAAIIGTLQAGYTKFPYLGETSEKIFAREALLGVSITGWMNSPLILFNETILRKGARLIKEVNALVAKMIGINPAARATCTKPSGNASVLLSTASGIHGEHSPRYIRNVQMNKDTEVAQLIKKHNPYMVEESVWSANGSDYVISFPIISPEHSIYRDQLYGVNLLEKVKLVQQSWVEEGTNVDLCVDPRIRHNVSNTINVRPEQWNEVEDYIFENRRYFAGISLLSASGDKDYAQAPNTEVLTEQQLIDKYGNGAIFASGLIVDGVKVFSHLWKAMDVARDNSTSTQENLDNQTDWIRRFHKFAENYFGNNVKKAEYCLKDVWNLHKWLKIQGHFKEIDFAAQLVQKKFTDIDTMGAVACAGNNCEI